VAFTLIIYMLDLIFSSSYPLSLRYFYLRLKHLNLVDIKLADDSPDLLILSFVVVIWTFSSFY